MADEPYGAALADGLYWYAEKLMWGYEGVEKNPTEAFKLYKQAAELGFSDAAIRMGELQEHGKGTPRDPRAAVKSYQSAAKVGNYYAFAFLARLLARASQLEQAEAIWMRFFKAFDANPDQRFFAASRGEVLHEYVSTQLRLGLEPRHKDSLRRHRLDIIGHHQRLLEHTPDERLDSLDAASEWMAINL